MLAKRVAKSVINASPFVTFAGISTHHQNGIAKCQIHKLQEMARTMLFHAQPCWPQAITSNLWPYAICMVNDTLNTTLHSKSNEVVPPEAFARVKVASNAPLCLTCLCPPTRLTRIHGYL